MAKIGVFICHCGINIAGVVDIQKVVDEIAQEDGVVISTDNRYMCSDPGQNMIKEFVSNHQLDRIVVASCTPRMHEKTFQRAASEAGLNPYLCEMVNIREQCAWVHEDRESATQKAIDLIKMGIGKVKKNEPLTSMTIPVKRRALVVGGGIAGMQASLDIAKAGFDVVMVEKSPTIGGRMAQLDKTFPTLDCSA